MPPTVKSTLRLHPDDDVVVALSGLTVGSPVAEEGIVCRQDLPAGHKLATRAVAAGQPVRKYGQVIGLAKGDITPGQHVHTHNLGLGDHARGQQARPPALPGPGQARFFQGIVRDGGQVGIRNYLGILAVSSCALDTAGLIARAFDRQALAPFPRVDGVVALGPGTGCCMTPGGEGMTYLRRALAGFARHPNFAGLLLLGLGCEQNQMGDFLAEVGLEPGERLRAVSIQDEGGARATADRGAALLRQMLPRADQAERQAVPAARLVLGLECGGSDAYSGITANPALGRAADLLVAQGGTAILSETPEIYGAEHLLAARATDAAVAAKLLARVRWWEEYAAAHGASLDNNPTPGNKAGGISTILEKSLGAATKAGSSNLIAVYDYAEPVQARGLVFMDTPGHDPVSVTGLIAGGAHLVCFTTGRGSVLGAKPAPVLKLASHSGLYRRLASDMDLDCGPLLAGETDLAEMGQRVFEAILAVASGHKTKSEELGFGACEFNPWHMGAVL